MGQAVRFREVLRKLAIIDERCVQDQAGALVAIGAPAVCLEWGTTRALVAGATADEITGVLLAVGPTAGLARVAGAVPDVAIALGYDVETALLEHPDDP